jgi:NADH-quinone oxidoreductase subunit N
MELQSLGIVALICLQRNNQLAVEAAIKYLLINSIATALFLFGVGFIYLSLGTVHWETLSYFTVEVTPPFLVSSGVCIGLIFLVCSLLFKLGVVPFHVWTPDIGEGACAPVALFLAVIPKFSVMIVLWRLCYGVFPSWGVVWQTIFWVCGMCSIIFSTFFALAETKFRRFLMYSSIGHLGFILLCSSYGELFGLLFAIGYLLFYLGTVLCLWVLFIIMSVRAECTFISHLGFLQQRMLCLVAGSLFFSLAGIPPLAGFWMKLGVLYVIAEEQTLFGFLTVFVLLVLSGIMCFYYLRAIKTMFLPYENIIFYFRETFSWSLACFLVLFCVFLVKAYTFFTAPPFVAGLMFLASSLPHSI